MGQAMSEVPKGDPLRIAWEAHQATEDFKNTKHWAMMIAPMVQVGDPDGDAKRSYDLMPREQRERHVMGSLWACFVAGWTAANSRRGEMSDTDFARLADSLGAKRSG